jgi:DNA-binding beta-propeller fold protein YncE
MAGSRARTLMLLSALLGCGQSGHPASGAGTGGGGGEGGGETGGTGGQAHSDAAADLATAGPDTALAADTSAPDLTPAPGDAPPSNGAAKIVLVAGGGSAGDGSPAVMAKLTEPFGTAVDPMTGEIYIAEYTGGHVRRVDSKGIISTVVGAGASGGGGKVTLGNPHDLLFQPGTRNLFIADTFANRVVKMDAATGETAVFAGAGTALAASMTRTFHLAFDQTGDHLYVTDNGAGKVVVIDLKANTATSIDAGANIRAIAVDSKNNLYLSNNNATLRKIDAAGAVSTVLGGGLNAPKHLAVDAADDLIIADTEISVIKRWSPGAASAVKIAGTGAMGTGTLGGAPEQAGLNRPHGVFVDAQGRIYVADSDNNRVLRIEH